jgi:two-component system, NtrC family, sensor kinase
LRGKEGPRRPSAKPAQAKIEAKLSVSRKAPKNEGARVRDLERRLAEAQEQQTATAEILSVISRSPTDIQPVFDAIVTNAARLCDAAFSAVFRFDGQLLQVAALNRVSLEETEAFHRVWPRLPLRTSIVGRAFLEGRAVHVEDVLADPDYGDQGRDLQRVVQYRTLVGIPLLREGVPTRDRAVLREAD